MEFVAIAAFALVGWVYWVDSRRIERVATELLKEIQRHQEEQPNDD